MNRKYLLMSIIIGLILGIIGGVINLPKLTKPESVNASSPADEALLLTLESYKKWSTVQGEADFIWYAQDGTKLENFEDFQIDQPNKAFINIRSLDGYTKEQQWISDGSNIYTVDIGTKTYILNSIPKFSKDFSMLPTNLEAARNTEAIYRHPFAMLIQPPVGEYLYPVWFSQGHGHYSLENEDFVINKATFVVNFQSENGDVTAWIDKETGIILKYVQKDDGKITFEMHFSKLIINEPIDDSIFSIPSGFIQATQ